MRGMRYRQFWLDRWLSHADVEKWTVQLDKDIHRAITDSGWWENSLFEKIRQRELEVGRLLERHEVIEAANELLDEVLGWLR